MVATALSKRTRDVKVAAFRLGFDRVAITTAEPFEREREVFEDRIDRGLYDGIGWMTKERAKRACSPRDHVPAARSVISLATSYLTVPALDTSRPGDPHGKVSRYAWGPDYHGFVGERAKALASELQERHGATAHPKPCVDTAALAERAVARRSGLGWFGKNTMLLTRTHGSWVFLAEVITDLELESDAPLRTSCGSCSRCQVSCPTGALDTAYELDSRLCISYLTVENRGPIPAELRPLMGTWIFGCDVCQDVCPVNRDVDTARPLDLVEAGGIGPSPALLPLLRLDDDGFRRRFRASPVRRAKRSGLLRNVCVALGNAGDPAAIGPLAATLVAEPEPLVRGHAAWALGRFRVAVARRVLDGARRTEPSDVVRGEIESALEAWDVTCYNV